MGPVQPPNAASSSQDCKASGSDVPMTSYWREERSTPQRPDYTRTPSAVSFADTTSQASHQQSYDETSPLLSHNGHHSYGFDGGVATPRTTGGHQSQYDSFVSTNPIKRYHSRTSSLRRVLVNAFGEGKQKYHGVGTPVAGMIRRHEDPYDQFTSIDWVHDNIADALRGRDLQSQRGLFGRILVILDQVQGWFLAALVGCLTAVLAYCIDVSETTLFDTKFGYCKRGWMIASIRRCCGEESRCSDWVSWSEAILPNNANGSRGLEFSIYVVLMLAMTLLSCMLVLLSKYTIIPWKPLKEHRDSVDEDNTHRARSQRPTQHQVILYPAAGSGVAEVKVISSGFIIHGYLGAKTLLLKAVACVLSVGSGLSIGKEGPYVHMAACIGNVACRISRTYDLNAAKRREMINAASAAGMAVAFGAPISGVLFSLEEVSYYFPAKTFFRTFFCSIIAAVALKFLDPYGTGKIVLFQVKYEGDWKAIEIVLYILLGIIGGATGGLIVKGTKHWALSFKKVRLIKDYPILEALIIALVTGAISYWNKYAKLPVAELMFELASDCRRFEETGTGLCPRVDEIPALIRTLFGAFAIKSFLTTISFGIKVPAGIYVPSMVVGGLLGRVTGHVVQYAIMKTDASFLFGSCTSDARPESCIVPGVYALVAAGATMTGVTRLTITLALMMFELSGSLDHILPFSIATLVAKWTADAIEPQSIYDLHMKMNSYPYLDNKSRPALTGELGDILQMPQIATSIDISASPLASVRALRAKVDFITETGQLDGAVPILKEDSLVGMISCADLAFCVSRLKGKDDSFCVVSPHFNWASGEEPPDSDDDPLDLTPFIDLVPFSLDIRSSAELVYECFAKLGLRYICVLREGYYVGLLHKKVFVKYTRELQRK